MTWRKDIGIPRAMFAQLADCSERKLATYEKTARLPVKVQRQFTETTRLIEALFDLVDNREELKSWLLRPNSAFDKRTPFELITQGESDVLWRMVHQLRDGAFA